MKRATNDARAVAELQDLLAMDHRAASLWQTSPPGLLDDAQRPLLLAGCGPLGQHTAAVLKRMGRPAQAFVDNHPSRIGTAVQGLSVLSPLQAMERFGAHALMVVTIYNGSPVRMQLQTLGCSHVLHFATLYHAMSADFLPYGAMAEPQALQRHANEILSCLPLWHDQASVDEFNAQIAWHLGATAPALAPPHPMAELYLASDLFRLVESDVVIDCGAFDGDSLRVLLASPTQRFGRYLGLEPDPANFARLMDYVDQLPELQRKKILLYPYAVASTAGVVRFAASGSVASKSSDEGDILARAETIDKAVGDLKASFIKMDIEGQELDALAGAARVIAEHRPILAISLYHRPTDLWRIPQAIRRLAPEHRLFLRRYAEDCWETVCYAVPPERDLSQPRSA